MAVIINKSNQSSNKALENKKRLIDRYKEAIHDVIAGDTYKPQSISGNNKVKIKKDATSEPHITHNHDSGNQKSVHPSDGTINRGDSINKRRGQSSTKGHNGEGDDEFMFVLDPEEFANILFEGLELPDLIPKQGANIEVEKTRLAGYTKEGVPANLNIVRTFKESLSRRIAIKASIDQDIIKLQEQREDAEDIKTVLEFDRLIKETKARKDKIPYLDDFDLRFDNRIKVKEPITKAVFVMVMDVSGSMDRDRKDRAKRFFYLLYLFLTRKYKEIELVFVKHTETAKEVTEQDFFYSQESGGTVMSTGLEVAVDILEDRYPLSRYNVYVVHASDGDNPRDDNTKYMALLQTKLMKLSQFFIYLEVCEQNVTYLSQLSDIYRRVYELNSDIAAAACLATNITPIQLLYDLFKGAQGNE